MLVIDEKPIKTVVAPMVAASDFPFRRLCRNYGADLCYTQMLHAKRLVGDGKFRRNHLDFCNWEALLTSQENCIQRMEPNDVRTHQPHHEGGPLVVQLAGNEPMMVSDAAQIVLDMAPAGVVSGFDLNCGCPQGIARKGGYGAFLMDNDERRVGQILKQLRTSMPPNVKVSAKIRLPPNNCDQALKERITMLVDSGVDFLTIHGRTIHENKTKVKACHFDKIRLAVETAQRIESNFPIVANGGLEDYRDIGRVLEQTGATAVMSSEALLEHPNLFASSAPTDPRQRFNQQIRLTREYLDLCAEFPPFPGVLGHAGGSFNIVRGHLFKLLHRYIQVHSDLIGKLADHNTMHTLKDVSEQVVDEIVRRYESDEVVNSCKSAKLDSTWYRRHWNVEAQKYAHKRGGKAGPVALPIEDRKGMMRARIKRLREERTLREKQQKSI